MAARKKVEPGPPGVDRAKRERRIGESEKKEEYREVSWCHLEKRSNGARPGIAPRVGTYLR